MLKRQILLASMLALLGCVRGSSFGVTGWVAQPYSINIPTHINTAGQSVNGSTNIVIQHDTPCTLTASIALAGNETFTSGTATLTTSYMLTGAALQNPDAGWIAAATFLSRLYNIQGSGTDTLALSVKADAPANTAADAGVYSASIILTVTW